MTARIEPVGGPHRLDSRGRFPAAAAPRAAVVWSGAELYAGGFRAGRKHGAGALVRASGAKLVVEWVDGYAHGRGTYLWPTGEVFIGRWAHGRRAAGGERRTRAHVGAAAAVQGAYRAHLARAACARRRMRALSRGRADALRRGAGAGGASESPA
jgi:hypothetical protein